MSLPKLLVAAVAAVAVATLTGCNQEPLDFRNAEISVNKVYAKGGNTPFTGLVTSIPIKHVHLPKDLKFVFEEFVYQLHALNDVYCTIEVDEGTFHGDATCAVGGAEPIVLEYAYKQGKVEGKLNTHVYTEFPMSAVFSFANDRLDGASYLYTDKDVILNKTTYKAGVPHGPYEMYYLEDPYSGVLNARGSFENGLEHGLQEAFDRSGAKTYEVMLVNGKREGVLKRWDENGKRNSDLLFKDGVLVK